jgi:hypothetical protein
MLCVCRRVRTRRDGVQRSSQRTYLLSHSSHEFTKPLEPAGLNRLTGLAYGEEGMSRAFTSLDHLDRALTSPHDSWVDVACCQIHRRAGVLDQRRRPFETSRA